MVQAQAVADGGVVIGLWARSWQKKGRCEL